MSLQNQAFPKLLTLFNHILIVALLNKLHIQIMSFIIAQILHMQS